MPQTQAAPSVLETLRESGDYEKLAQSLPNDWQQRPPFEYEAIRWRLVAAELAARTGGTDAMKRALLPYLDSVDKVPFVFAPAALLGCASYHYHCRKTHKALRLAHQAAGAAQAREDELTFAEAVQLEGMALFALEKFDEAIERLYKAIALYSEQARPYRMGLANLSLGVAFNRVGRAEEAHEALERAIKLLSKSRDEHSLALARFHVAQSLRATGEPDTAYHYLLFALETFEKQNDQHLHAALNEAAATLVLLKDYEAAAHYLARALALPLHPCAAQFARSHEVKARLHIARREFEAAEAEVNDSLEIARQTGCRLDEARGLRTLGRLRLAQKRSEAAEAALERGLELAEDGREPLLELEVRSLLAQAVCESNPVEAFKLAAEVETRLAGRNLCELKKEAKAARNRLNALDQEHYFVLSDARLPSLSEARVLMLKWLWARSLYKAKGNARRAAAILGVTPTYIRRLTKVIPRDLLKPRKKKAKRGA